MDSRNEGGARSETIDDCPIVERLSQSFISTAAGRNRKTHCAH